MAKFAQKVKALLPRSWSPNQVVAHNLTRARLLRGWTQEDAAAALAPYLGSKLSVPSFSAIERSIAGTRVKQFSADELVALSRAFDLPLGWWFTPPAEGNLSTPDHGIPGTDFALLVDVVLGTPATLPPWIEALNTWAAKRAASDTVPARAGDQADVRARTLVRERFGDLAEARDVLRRLADLIDDLDDPTPDDTVPDQATRGTVGARRKAR
jgi:transcriptional regulator with XRE-family HTH domain